MARATDPTVMVKQAHQHQQPVYYNISPSVPLPLTSEEFLLSMGYKLGRTLGHGSYAKVKVCEHHDKSRRLMKTCAVKIIDRRKAPSDFLNKFLPRELDICMKLKHKHIISVEKTIRYRHREFIFMELAEGGDLLDYIKKKGALKNEEAKRMFNELTSAIEYCHNLQITHRDLKCENVLLDANNGIKLADFGFSRYCVNPQTFTRVLSETYCGSAAYAAPEILKGQPYNPKLYDIWSLGCILYIMVCAQMPFDDKDVRKMLKVQLESKISFHNLDINPLVKELIMKMLEPDVTRRFNIQRVRIHKWFSESDTNNDRFKQQSNKREN